MSQLVANTTIITDVLSRTTWILDTFEDSRNFTENEFLFCYWETWEGFSSEAYDPRILTSHETISRCKRKLVEKNPKYKANNNVNRAKQKRRSTFREWSKS